MKNFNASTYNWANCVPEILVTDYQVSLKFYQMLGFQVQYTRENFAYLEYNGGQFMISQRDNYWETGDMQVPFGRGVNFQFASNEVDALIARLKGAGVLLYQDRYEKWRELGGQKGGSIEFLVQDPDGYLLRFLQEIK